MDVIFVMDGIFVPTMRTYCNTLATHLQHTNYEDILQHISNTWALVLVLHVLRFTNHGTVVNLLVQGLVISAVSLAVV